MSIGVPQCSGQPRRLRFATAAPTQTERGTDSGDRGVRPATPKSVRDYRAGATIDFELDSADKDRQIATPLLLLWATRGAPASPESAKMWPQFASNIVDTQSVPSGHHMQEEAPDQVYEHLAKFFAT